VEEQDMYEAQPIPIEQGGHASATSNKYQLEYTEILDEIDHTLKSESPCRDARGQLVWRVPVGVRPLINNKGVDNIVMILRSHLSKIFILSNLEQDTIEDMTITLGQNIIDDLYYNWERYGIKDTAAASTILCLVCNTVYATLRKGHKGEYLRFLSKTTQANEVQHIMQKQASNNEPGILGKMFGKKKRY